MSDGTRIGDYKYCAKHRCNHLRSAFCKNINATDGLNGWCREAMREYRAGKARPAKVKPMVTT